jgi:Cdc6-like AAA superfamily ATPase
MRQIITHGYWRAVLADDEESLEIVSYTGNETHVKIPRMIEGLPVSGIGSPDFYEPVFYHCRKMKTLYIPDTIENIKPYCIHGCINLRRFRVSEDSDTFEEIDGIISYGRSIVLFPSGIKGDYKLPFSPRSIYQGAFYQSSLRKLDCGSCSVSIRQGAFLDASNLEDLIIGNAVVHGSCFVGCRSLKRIFARKRSDYNSDCANKDGVLYNYDYSQLIFFPPNHEAQEFVIPDSVTRINEYAFAHCKDKTIVFSKGLTSIGKAAFMYAQNLKLVEQGTLEDINNNTFTHSKNINIKTNNYFVMEAVSEAQVPDITIERAMDMKSQDSSRKLTRAEHLSFAPEEAKAIINERGCESENSYRADNRRAQIKLLKSFPWGVLNERVTLDLRILKQNLDQRVFGMETVKKKVLRWAASLIHCPEAPVRGLILVGPPGCGKTTVAQAISESMGRALAVCHMPSIESSGALSGTSHIWSNARQGKVIDEFIQHGCGLVMLFDEIDKTSTGVWNENPINALLSLFDSSRSRFVDNFFQVPIDLSHTPMICTANSLDLCNKFLVDRCRLLELPGYFGNDRATILRDYVIPKIRKQRNLSEEQCKLSDGVLEEILSRAYSKEGSVRILETVAEEVVEYAIYILQYENKSSVQLTKASVKKLLDEAFPAKEEKRIGFTSGGFCR